MYVVPRLRSSRCATAASCSAAAIALRVLRSLAGPAVSWTSTHRRTSPIVSWPASRAVPQERVPVQELADLPERLVLQPVQPGPLPERGPLAARLREPTLGGLRSARRRWAPGPLGLRERHRRAAAHAARQPLARARHVSAEACRSSCDRQGRGAPGGQHPGRRFAQVPPLPRERPSCGNCARGIACVSGNDRHEFDPANSAREPARNASQHGRRRPAALRASRRASVPLAGPAPGRRMCSSGRRLVFRHSYPRSASTDRNRPESAGISVARRTRRTRRMPCK